MSFWRSNFWLLLRSQPSHVALLWLAGSALLATCALLYAAWRWAPVLWPQQRAADEVRQAQQLQLLRTEEQQLRDSLQAVRAQLVLPRQSLVPQVQALARRMGLQILLMREQGSYANASSEGGGSGATLRLKFLASFGSWLRFRAELAQLGIGPLEEVAEPTANPDLVQVAGLYRQWR